MFIALTGGIGCGKSAALAGFAQCGFFCSDADKVCHSFYETPQGIAAVSARWPQVLDADGAIDRKKLGNIVFRDENDLAYLESLVTPYLCEKMEEFRRRPDAVMMEIPLLFEKHFESWCDKVVSVWSPFALRRERLAARGWDHAECSRRERLQWTPEQKLAAADYGIINTGSLDMLYKQCREISDIIAEENNIVLL